MKYFGFLIFAFIMLSWFVQSANSVADLYDHPYYEAVNMGLFFKHLLSISPFEWTNVFNVFQLQILFGLISLLMIKLSSLRNKRPFLWMVILASLFPMTWVGGLTFITGIFRIHDGEWLEEGWPIIEATFVWWCCMLVFVLKSPDLSMLRLRDKAH
jgi:hypothetical protein